MFQRTKIVATLGPASEKPQTIAVMIKAGMDIARLNASHGTHESHARLFAAVRAQAKKCREPIMIFLDLQGPKIRVGDLPKDGIKLAAGDMVRLIAGSIGGKGEIPIRYPRLLRDLSPGARVLFDDGALEFEAVKKDAKGMRARVVIGGILLSHKGVNFPGRELGISALTPKDREDARFGVRLGVDFFALSFVRRARDVETLRRLLPKGKDAPKIIVKIEQQAALLHFDEILQATDAVMVARGDLALEAHAADVPLYQKMIIEKCRSAGKPVIVATEMLGSMVSRPRPTRAEISDVANAVIDHADAVMLSAESASGKYPVETVAMMAEIISETEKSKFDDIHASALAHSGLAHDPSWNSVGALIAEQKEISAILVSSAHVREIGTLARFRPEVPVVAQCANERQARQMNLFWGVVPVVASAHERAFVSRARKELLRRKLIKSGARALLVQGDQSGAVKELQM